MKMQFLSTRISQRLTKLKTGVLLIAAGFFASACSSDDDEGVNPHDQINANAEILEGDYDDLHLTNIFADPQATDYIVVGDISINAELKIDPGVRIEVQDDLEIVIEESGHVLASGSEEENIIITSANPAAEQHWKGIRIYSSDMRNSLSHTVVEYAGSSKFSIGPYSNQNRAAGVAVDDDGVLSLEHCVIQNSKSYGVYVRGELNEFKANKFNDNDKAGIAAHVRNLGKIDATSTYTGNSFSGVKIIGGNLLLPAKWNKLSDGAFYKISGHISVEAHLTISEGTKLHFDEDVEIIINKGASGTSHDGIIEVKGTASNPVLFTSSNKAGGQHWKGLRVNTTDTRNSLDHAVFEYGGQSAFSIGPYSNQNRKTNIGVDEDAQLYFGTVTSSHSNGWGIAAINSEDIDIGNADLTYENNTQGDLEIVN